MCNQSDRAFGGTLLKTTEWWPQIERGGCIRAKVKVKAKWIHFISKLYVSNKIPFRWSSNWNHPPSYLTDGGGGETVSDIFFRESHPMQWLTSCVEVWKLGRYLFTASLKLFFFPHTATSIASCVLYNLEPATWTPLRRDCLKLCVFILIYMMHRSVTTKIHRRHWILGERLVRQWDAARKRWKWSGTSFVIASPKPKRGR